MIGIKKPKSNVKDAKRKDSGGDGNTDKEKKQRSKRDARTRVHEKSLENRESVTDSSIVVAVETLFPMHPVGRRFIVTLNHLHLVDSFPKDHHVFIHHSPSSVVVVTQGGLSSSLGYGADPLRLLHQWMEPEWRR